MEYQTIRRSYDHRIKTLVAKAKNPYLFKQLNIPHSNTYRWAREGVGDIVTSEIFDDGVDYLIIKLKESEDARNRAEALIELLANGANTKDILFSAIERATGLCGQIEKPTIIADSGPCK